MGWRDCCCGRRKAKLDDPERRPLLSQDGTLGKAHNALEYIADALAALQAGKLPTQAQFNALIRALLKSDIMKLDAQLVNSISALSAERTKIVSDLRTLLEYFAQFGLEKNSDDSIQEFIHSLRRMSKVPVSLDAEIQADKATTSKIDTIAFAIPSEDESQSDNASVVSSIRSLMSLLLSSATFRLLLSDAFEIGREIIADAIARVGRTAAQVEHISEEMEAAIRVGGVRDAYLVEKMGLPKDPKVESREDINEVLLSRITNLFQQTQEKPVYKASMKTILLLFRKYVAWLQLAMTTATQINAPTINPIVIPDPKLIHAMSCLKRLLERMASGHSLDPLFDKALSCLSYISSTQKQDGIDLNGYFNKIGHWLDRALSDNHFVETSQAQVEIRRLLSEGSDLIQSHGAFSHLFHDVAEEIHSFVTSLKQDRLTMKLVGAINAFAVDVTSSIATVTSESASTASHWRRELAAWLVYRLFQAVKSVPMPRFELTSLELDAAVDAMMLNITVGASSLLPDSIVVQEWAEVRITPRVGGDEDTEVHSTTRMRIHVEGLRVAAYDVGYFANYKFGGRRWLGYEDEGLLDVVIGQPGVQGEGVNLDVELETSLWNGSTIAAPDIEPFFKILEVQADVPGLRLAMRKSKHWLLNALFFTPLSGPIGRLAARHILKKQVKSALENLEKVLSTCKSVAERKAKVDGPGTKVGLEHLWAFLFDGIGYSPSPAENSESEDDEDEDEDAHTKAQTELTPLGIVRTTITQPEAEDGEEIPEPIKTSIAIGIGAQILPGKAEPAEVPTVTTIAEEALEEAHDAVKITKVAVRDGIQNALRLRRNLEVAGRRIQMKQAKERRGGGWRSQAFDFGLDNRLSIN